MTVAELITLLQTQPQGLRVARRMHSEYCLLEPNDIVADGDLFVVELPEANPPRATR
jgi:hypothetical protein